MAKVHLGVVGGSGITKKGPATKKWPRPLRRWSSGTMDFPSPDRGMPPVIPVRYRKGQTRSSAGAASMARHQLQQRSTEMS
jgi:hypothetical protein